MSDDLPPPLGFHTVIAPTGRAYDCSTLERVARHLAELSGCIARAQTVGDLAVVRHYREDQDALLARRDWLIHTEAA